MPRSPRKHAEAEARRDDLVAWLYAHGAHTAGELAGATGTSGEMTRHDLKILLQQGRVRVAGVGDFGARTYAVPTLT